MFAATKATWLPFTQQVRRLVTGIYEGLKYISCEKVVLWLNFNKAAVPQGAHG